MVDKSSITYKTSHSVAGPLLFVDLKNRGGVAYSEIVEIHTAAGEIRQGRVLDITNDLAVVQVYEGTDGLDTDETSIRFLGETSKFGVTRELLGRVLTGRGKPLDGGPELVPEKILDIEGSPINPSAREYPREFIETGISVLDSQLTLVRGQKLPLFSGSGLPHNRLAAQIARQARVLGTDEDFAVVFAAMGITADEATFFQDSFEETGALGRSVLFLNLADDPAIERLVTPRFALTAAEYLAFELDYSVLVILTDITNYSESLRRIGAAREEVPGRRGYPGYMYSDFSTIYERAGRIRGKKGSITQIPILTMPSDDITHPIPDLSGYITEGQVFLDRGLHRKGIYPPINPLPSLSRLAKEAMGHGMTRHDHNDLQNQLAAVYASGRKARELMAVVGEDALSEEDHKFLQFAEQFEQKFIHQGMVSRDIFETLETGWELMSLFPYERQYFRRISPDVLEKFHPQNRDPNHDFRSRTA